MSRIQEKGQIQLIILQYLKKIHNLCSGVVGGGGGTPVPPLDMHPPRPPPLEQEVGTRTNLFNLHIYS